MSRKTLIMCLSALAVMILAIVVAVAFLYTGSSVKSGSKTSQVAAEDRSLLFSAVPSDALLAASFSSAQKASGSYLSGFKLFDAIAKETAEGRLSLLKRGKVAISLHYSGKLCPLYVFEAGKVGEAMSEDAGELVSFLAGQGLHAEYVDCSAIEGVSRRLARQALVIASEAESIVKVSKRHLQRGVSVFDSPGFTEAIAALSGDDMLLIFNPQAGKILPAVMSRRFAVHAGFLASVADWSAFDLSGNNEGTITFSGTACHDADPSDFMNVIEAAEPGKIQVADVLPSYTLSASSLAVRDAEGWNEVYSRYVESRRNLRSVRLKSDTLKRLVGMSPLDYMKHLKVSEVASASFVSGSTVRRVNLMRVGISDVSTIFKGTDIRSLKDYEPGVHTWSFPGLAACVFGQLFALPDETCFTYIDGWIVTGEAAAVEEYASGKALEYTLSTYLSNAGYDRFDASHSSLFRSYFSFNEGLMPSADVFSASFGRIASGLTADCDCACAVLDVKGAKNASVLSLNLSRLTLHKTQAPVTARDTVVVIPEGPFKVKNSGTGKDNLFYQNSHLSLCLKEEGKDLWGVPFKNKICGTASNVDFFANGKLQIAFGAGSSIYLIDRLGRYVNGFPVDLGKEILLGPALYDFNGTRKYNAVVLHKDNTIEMYNLKGQKPASWKGIKPDDRIMGLPERIKVGGSSFWVVRTAVQTLIYPFYGGETLTVFEGDKKIRTDSDIKAVDQSSVEFMCYDGRKRTLQLK